MSGRVSAGRRRAPRAALAVCVLAAPMLLAYGPTPVAAQAPLAQFRASAHADGLRQTVVRPEAPLSENVVDVGIPSAQAVVNSLGDSEAYGSFLYPGASIRAVPGLLSGPTGQSLPDYPLLAFSNSPGRPEDDASAGPVTIQAKSAPTTSTGTSSWSTPGAGIGRLLAFAESSADAAAGTLKATARTEATGLDVEGVLRVASVRSDATAELANGKVTTSSGLAIGETTVAGVRVTVTEQGFILPGQTVPLPDSSPILEPLSDAGISVDLVAPEEINGGIRSAALRIAVTQPTPDGSSATTTYLLGQSLTSVAATAGDVEPPTTFAAPPPDISAFTPDTGTPADTGLTPAPDLAGADTSLSVAAPPAAAPAPATTGGSGGGQAVPVAFGSVPFSRSSALTFYLVLVLAAGVALVSQQALRRFGVRQTWTP